MILTSHRFHNVIIHIIAARLLKAASLGEHVLVLDISHPTTNAPYLFCQYLSSGPINTEDAQSNNDSVGKLGELTNIYSRFRPLIPEKNRTKRRLHPASDLFIGQLSDSNENETGYVCQDIHLESHELFSQLCTYTNLVKVSNDRGLLQTSVGISDGVIRVWRKWLAGRCVTSVKHSCDMMPSSSKETDDEEDENGILWADNKKHVGLRTSVVAKDNLLDDSEEDTSVSYTLQYQGTVIHCVGQHNAKLF